MQNPRTSLAQSALNSGIWNPEPPSVLTGVIDLISQTLRLRGRGHIFVLGPPRPQITSMASQQPVNIPSAASGVRSCDFTQKRHCQVALSLSQTASCTSQHLQFHSALFSLIDFSCLLDQWTFSPFPTSTALLHFFFYLTISTTA